MNVLEETSKKFRPRSQVRCLSGYRPLAAELEDSMHVDRAGRLALAGARRRAAQAADVVLRDLVRVRDEVAAALRALGHRQHAVVDELDEAPGPRDRQQRLEALCAGLLLVKLVGLDDRVDL